MFLKEPNFIIIGTLLALLTFSDGKAQSSPGEIDTLFYRGIALGNSNLDSTLTIARKMTILSREFRDDYGNVKARILSAYVYFNRFKLDTTTLLLNDCEQWFRDHPTYYETENHGRVKLYQTRLCVRKQEYRLARTHGLHALAIFRKINNRKYEGDALGALGIIEYLTEKFPTALNYYVEAIKAKSTSADATERLSPDLLLNISQVYGRMGQYENARNYARKSLSSRADNANPEVGNIYNSIGSYHSSENRFDSAMYFYQLAKEHAANANKPHMIFVADYNIANAYSRSGDFKRSNSTLKKAIGSASNIPTGMLETSEQLLAKNYLNLARFDSAILTARRTYRKNLARNNKLAVIADADVLSKAFGQSRRKDSAIFYLKIKNAFQDSLYNAGNQKKLSALYAEMETIAKQHEIEILRQDTELAVAENKVLQLSMIFGGIVIPLAVGLLFLYFRNRRKKQKLLSYQLSTELDQRKKDLHQQALRMIYINNGLTEIEASLKKISPLQPDNLEGIQQLFTDIQLNRSLEQEWEHFYRYFGSVHSGFYEKFNSHFPTLSQPDKRLAGLVRMNLTNSEIAGLLNIENKSVKMAKYRLKKKLELNDEQDIHQFLQTFG